MMGMRMCSTTSKLQEKKEFLLSRFSLEADAQGTSTEQERLWVTGLALGGREGGVGVVSCKLGMEQNKLKTAEANGHSGLKAAVPSLF